MNSEFEDIPLQGEKPEATAIRASELVAIIQALDAEPRLQAIFGQPVSESLVVIAEGWDLRIECFVDEISEEDGKAFMQVLDEIIHRQKDSSKGL